VRLLNGQRQIRMRRFRWFGRGRKEPGWGA
jgi:hypothetical protein